MDGIRDRDSTGLGHLFVELLLLHLFQLVLQFVLVDLVADSDAVHGFHDLVAERVLLPQFLPVKVKRVSGTPGRSNPR